MHKIKNQAWENTKVGHLYLIRGIYQDFNYYWLIEITKIYIEGRTIWGKYYAFPENIKESDCTEDHAAQLAAMNPEKQPSIFYTWNNSGNSFRLEICRTSRYLREIYSQDTKGPNH